MRVLTLLEEKISVGSFKTQFERFMHYTVRGYVEDTVNRGFTNYLAKHDLKLDPDIGTVFFGKGDVGEKFIGRQVNGKVVDSFLSRDLTFITTYKFVLATPQRLFRSGKYDGKSSFMNSSANGIHGRLEYKFANMFKGVWIEFDKKFSLYDLHSKPKHLLGNTDAESLLRFDLTVRINGDWSDLRHQFTGVK